jgi:hypothetical protein
MEPAVKPKLCIFGNSHVSAFSGTDEIVDDTLQMSESEDIIYMFQRLGPCTAYNFFWNPNYYPRVLDLLAQHNPDKEYTVALLLGEIDCRVHIGLNAEKASRPVNECIEEVIDRYLLCLLDLKQRGYEVLVFAVQPASTFPPSTNPERPAHGHFIFRNSVTRKFNTILEHKSNLHGFLFCSIFDTLMEDETTPNMEYFMDYVHLRGSMVRPLFDKALTAIL